jgi:hypothetical protein
VRTTRDAFTDLARERYSEQQLVEILRRAAERQEGLNSEPDGRFSLAEIQQFASEVGINPAHVAVAAAELAHSTQPPPSTVLGAPTAFRFERWLDGEIPTSAIGELFDVARRETGFQGQVSEALDTVEWRGRGSMGITIVSVARRGGRTQITVYVARTDAAALVASTTGVGGLAGAAVIGTLLAAGAAAGGPIAVAGVIAVSLGWAGSGSWLAMRGIWRRVARQWVARTDALGQEIVAVAQRAIDAARTDSG